MLTNRMLSLQTITRNITPYSGAARHQLHTSIKLLSASSSDSSDSGSDSDRESKKSVKKVKTQSRKEGLDTLSTLITELNQKTATVPRIDVAIPKKPPRTLPEKEPVSTEESRFEAKFVSAAKNVAEKLGGDVKQTEMDLLDRLLKKKDTSNDGKSKPEPSLNQSDILKGIKIDRTKESDREMEFQKQREERIRTVSQKVDKFKVQVKDDRSIMRNLLQDQSRSEFSRKESKPFQDEKSYAMAWQTSKSVLRELRDEQKRSEFSPKESKLSENEIYTPLERQDSRSTIRELQQQQKRSETPQKEFKSPQDGTLYISEPVRPQSTLWELYREKRRSRRSEGSHEARTPSFRFHGKKYGIFEEEPTEKPQVQELSTWSHLEMKELKTLLYHPPQNYFQEMIQWTEQGKIWQFPIDNEQGMKGEENVHFSEHVFLERHLKGWCPKKGPIRHFMELVCVGLSKNAFMTVEEKTDHIMWYKDYFGDKRELLVELGAIENEDPSVLPKPTNKIDLGPHV